MSLNISLDTRVSHALFRYGMYWRIVYGSLRLTLGLMLIKVISAPFSDILRYVFSYELAEDPGDLLYATLNNYLLAHPISVSYFMATYLIMWGIIDIALSVSLLRHQVWAFPASMILIGVFVLYEIYRFFHTQSAMLLLVILVDAAVFWLILKEYEKMRTVGHRKVI